MRKAATPILIVGGAASGMALANDLGYRNIECMVIEEGDGVIKTPKTGHISARTMEHCRRWGFVGQVWNSGFPRDLPLDTVLCTSLAGYELSRKNTPSIQDTKPLPWSPENRVRCPQMIFDPLLAARAQDHASVTVHYGWRFDDFEPDPRSGGLVAHVTDVTAGEKLDVECQYLIGADGANSTVRRRSGIEMSGNPLMNYQLIILFRCPGFFDYHDKGRAERYSFIGPEGFRGNITAVNGTDLWRLSLKGQPTHYDLDSFDPREAVYQAFGRTDVDFDVELVDPWKCTELVADQYVIGAAFLAGDAAHTMSPTGGFGMNTAIDDSVNLGWKLWAIAEGWGGPGLLPSYEAERRPIGLRNCRMASENFNLWEESVDLTAILDDTEAGEAARREAARAYDRVASRIQGSVGVILGYRYEDSPICIPDGTPAPPDEYDTYVPTSRPGSRAPHVWLDQQRQKSTLDLFGKKFVLFSSDGAVEQAELLAASARARNVPFSTVCIDTSELAGLYDRDLVLVRPDGHVCYAGSPSVSAEAVADHVLNVVTGWADTRRRIGVPA